MIGKNKWKEAQAGEKICWEWNREKIISPEYLELKRGYWREVLGKIPEIDISEDSRILDVGCGPSGILLAIDKGKRTGIDSLMDYYLDYFPHLRDMDVNWVRKPIEEYGEKEKFDCVFMMNSLDHVRDPRKTVEKVRDLLTDDGILIVSLNCHNYRIFKVFFSVLNMFVDYYHPFQWDKDDVARIFGDFKLLRIDDIDEERIRLSKNQTNAHGKKTTEAGYFFQKVRVIINLPNALVSFIGFLGLPRHKTNPRGKSIFSQNMFILKKRI